MAEAERLRWSLRRFGISDSAINAAWPRWWSEAADASPSARAELRFSLSRKLGLDPRSLAEGDSPKFVWRDEAKFKRLASETEFEQAALVSFGVSIGRALVSATEEGPSISGLGALALRQSILASQQFVQLQNLLGTSWGLGIPVIYLRVFPLAAKRTSAMVVRVGGRFAILLARDARYPAPIAFYLAHELGHAALGHVGDNVAVVDYGEVLAKEVTDDGEEAAADRYALELLTGMPSPAFLPQSPTFNARALAHSLLRAAPDLRIDPGTMAMCFGYSTQAWEKANAAMKLIYPTEMEVWRVVNSIAASQLKWSQLNEDESEFLKSVMGGAFSA